MLWASIAAKGMVKLMLSVLELTEIKSLARVMKYLKAVSVRAKQMQHSTDVELNHIFELDVLVNRGVGSLDWNREQINRQEPHMVDISERTVYTLARQTFSEGKQQKKSRYKRMEWKEWWTTHWLHTPGGSVHPVRNALTR